ncbi:MAG: nucleotidyltransferase family protein [Hyphomicrobiaceae bacterium]
MARGRAYLFGSTARNEAKPTSDVDIFIDRDPQLPIGMMELTGLEYLLEEALGVDVDRVTRSSLHPALRDDIENTAIRIV